MKKENYGGARQMADFAENLWGWQVTVRDAVDEDKWRQVFEVYVEDKYGMELSEFFDEHNPWAYQSMTARMLEAVRKGYWETDEKTTRKLAAEYAVNVVEKGVACCDHTCNNPMLNQMTVNLISIPGVLSPEMAEKFKLAVEKAAKSTLSSRRPTARSFWKSSRQAKRRRRRTSRRKRRRNKGRTQGTVAERPGRGHCRKSRRIQNGRHGYQGRNLRTDFLGNPVDGVPVHTCHHRTVRLGRTQKKEGNMVWKSLILGVVFSIGVFAVKGGVGLQYYILKPRPKRKGPGSWACTRSPICSCFWGAARRWWNWI